MTGEPTAWLVLGGIHLLNGARLYQPSDPVRLVPVTPVERVRPSNTIVVDWSALGPVDVRTVCDGRFTASYQLDGADLFPGGRLHPALGDDGGSVVPEPRSAACRC